ncbi:RNase adapter RapZ [Eilatimonas milleporae]|uniref:UPF0042 nucleotide-binding protein n=1 Tax=Eilatimonas milleporae TaxID=911205 RepID=A0A3M0C7M1_9PROT|nr:RNase adapter RapZ [Eilatimonas milleporae]RMB02796.1 UPF0042 nucleotide-binding protein [Eilatimonas milleporae]
MTVDRTGPDRNRTGHSLEGGGSLRRLLVFVTGLSGAGKSTALSAFEDLGFDTADNLPPPLLDGLLDLTEHPDVPLAVGIDSRTPRFEPTAFLQMLDRLKQQDGLDVSVVFLDADDEILVRRFSETRRRHPLAASNRLAEGIAAERTMLRGLRDAAGCVIDTSMLTGGDTRRLIRDRFAGGAPAGLFVTCMSFGFSKGVPRDADLVFDVRFLRNPHYDPDLKPLTGRDGKVADFVRADPGFAPFVDRLGALLDLLLPRYEAEGKAYLTLAFGCTGGKHRSVMMAETIAAQLGRQAVQACLFHRDLPRVGV